MNIKFSKYDSLMLLSDMKTSPYQRNKHPKEQIERLAQIMKAHGVRHPISISTRTNTICFGHGRKDAALLNGWDQYPIIYQDFDSDDEEYSCVQSDNAIASWAELDLSGINTDIGTLGPDFEIDLLGIENFTIEPFDKFLNDSQHDNLIKEVNRGDENSEWVGMPEFKTVDTQYFNLIYQFKSDHDRYRYVQDNSITVDHKMSNQWIIYK